MGEINCDKGVLEMKGVLFKINIGVLKGVGLITLEHVINNKKQKE